VHSDEGSVVVEERNKDRPEEEKILGILAKRVVAGHREGKECVRGLPGLGNQIFVGAQTGRICKE